VPVIEICVRKEEKDRFRRVYSILTNWTQKDQVTPAPKGRECVQINENKMNVSIYSILMKRTQKLRIMSTRGMGNCVRKGESKKKVQVYCVLTKRTQKDQDRLASADGNCVQFALLGCYNEYIVLYESGRRFSLGMRICFTLLMIQGGI